MAKVLVCDYIIRATMRVQLGDKELADFNADPEAVRKALAEGIYEGSSAANSMSNEVMSVEADMPKVIDL